MINLWNLQYSGCQNVLQNYVVILFALSLPWHFAFAQAPAVQYRLMSPTVIYPVSKIYLIIEFVCRPRRYCVIIPARWFTRKFILAYNVREIRE